MTPTTAELAAQLSKQKARAKKVVLLTATCIQKGVTSLDLTTLDTLGWAALTALSDVRRPSDETKRDVADLLARVEDGRI